MNVCHGSSSGPRSVCTTRAMTKIRKAATTMSPVRRRKRSAVRIIPPPAFRPAGPGDDFVVASPSLPDVAGHGEAVRCPASSILAAATDVRPAADKRTGSSVVLHVHAAAAPGIGPDVGPYGPA